MHCYFVLAGKSDVPVIYYVERVRDGRSFITRTVQARQLGKCIFTTTLSFVAENSAGEKKLQHASAMPTDIHEPVQNWDEMEFPAHLLGPYESQFLEMLNENSAKPWMKRTRQWMRCRGSISEEGGHQAHLAALAYMTDSYLLGTIARVQDVWRSMPMPKTVEQLTQENEERKKKLAEVGPNEEIQADKTKQIAPEKFDPENITPEMIKRLADRWNMPKKGGPRKPAIGMMVSLDHTIYFHRPRLFKADQWIFTQAESPWADDGRGLVMQRMYTKDGELIATCVQEVSGLYFNAFKMAGC
jgi:acyl-CoA thioesterase 8